MARVLLFSATPTADQTPEHLAPVLALRAAEEIDRFREHSLTSDPDTADVILFAESYGAGWHFEGVRRHPLVRRFREKCFLFCANPFVIPFLPGIYTGVERRWATNRTAPGFYVGLPNNEFMTYAPATAELPYLFSFIGSPGNAPVRKCLMQLAHPRGFVLDSSKDYSRVLHGALGTEETRAYRRRYAEVLQSSKFVLCPRGLSASTIRVFETMEVGRVPVILADDWVAPHGPAWDKFAIRIPEADCAEIPAMLEAREHNAIAMGELARHEWLEWFSPDVVFHRTVESCLEIKHRRRIPERFARWAVFGQYLRPFHFRRLIGRQARRLRSAPLRF